MIRLFAPPLLLGLALASTAKADEACAIEAANTLRPALLKEIADRYAGRADAMLQLELALERTKAMYRRGDCPRSLAALKWAPDGELAPLARVIVGVQAVEQDVTRLEREVKRRSR
jgi:phage terminase large subunit-like protein